MRMCTRVCVRYKNKQGYFFLLLRRMLKSKKIKKGKDFLTQKRNLKPQAPNNAKPAIRIKNIH